MALSPDGRTLAIATPESSVQLVDTATGAVRAELVGHDTLITAATFSADGTRVATTSNDETVAVWDATTGKQLDVLRGHAGSVLDVAFSQNGSTLFSSGADRSVFMWDVEGSSGLARSVTGPSLDATAATQVLVSPTADTITVAGERVHVIHLDEQRVVDLATGNAHVAWAAYRPDGRTLVTVQPDGTTQLWRVADGELLAWRSGRGFGNAGAVAFAADGSYVAAGRR